MTSRFACPKAAEAKVVRPGAGRCRACGSRSHFGRRCCLTAGATTDHSPNLAFVRRHSARPETAVQLQHLQNHVQNCSAAVLPRIQWPLPFLKHWIRGLPIFFNPLCGPKPFYFSNRYKVGSAAAMGDWPRRARRANAMGGVVAGAV